MYAKRTDANQKVIVAALKKLGCQVWVIGLPVDLLVCSPSGETFLIEVKRDTKASYTSLQKEFMADWRGRVETVRSVDDVLSLLSHTTA